MNRQTQSVFGYDRDDLVSQPIETLVHEPARPVHHRNREGYLAEHKGRGMGSGLQVTALRRDGSQFPVDISLSHYGDGGDLLVIAVVRDMTARIEA